MRISPERLRLPKATPYLSQPKKCHPDAVQDRCMNGVKCRIVNFHDNGERERESAKNNTRMKIKNKTRLVL